MLVTFAPSSSTTHSVVSLCVISVISSEIAFGLWMEGDQGPHDLMLLLMTPSALARMCAPFLGQGMVLVDHGSLNLPTSFVLDMCIVQTPSENSKGCLPSCALNISSLSCFALTALFPQISCERKSWISWRREEHSGAASPNCMMLDKIPCGNLEITSFSFSPLILASLFFSSLFFLARST